MRKLTCVLIVYLVGVAVGTAASREWHDATGTLTREAEFVALNEGRVEVRLPSGKSAHAPLEQLSIADREYVSQLIAARAATQSVTAAAADKMKVAPAVFETHIASGENATAAGAGIEATQVAMQAGASDSTAALPPAGATTPAGEGSSFSPTTATATAGIKKYVYYGCHSTTHLLDFGPKQGTGTIHYWLRSGDPCGSGT